MNYLSFNGKLMPAAEPVLQASNRGYRYGDGLFETLKYREGELVLGQFHFDRLFEGLQLLKFQLPPYFNRETITESIHELCRANKTEERARVRLSVLRGEADLYENGNGGQSIIESWPLDEASGRWNEEGWVIGIFPGARKSCDQFSNLKSASFSPYVMAAIHARGNKWDDSLVLNTKGNIADSSIANIFIYQHDSIITPSLEEGCVSGVMRRFLLQQFREWGLSFREEMLSPGDLQEAEEVFLTNAIRGIRWVRQCGDRVYTKERTAALYRQLGRVVPL